ncbi:hypothetical protein OM076_11250 [Solirubrobacter ginsenosidimutans]|uniref:Calcium-binding protein n=1 Tax=Solirubrobacter ginsenosidimutans TaxID=490573 RepID=A0A9X3MR55_9ACTN|nr:calcium-binding protein [Solirubrobacter ginsenosidimutans]MDA0160842.1 hypothetical protein [Solirubrobacter ginsenosidimutans]
MFRKFTGNELDSLVVNWTRSFLLAALAAVVLPASASAATVERVGNEIHFVAAAGETNMPSYGIASGILIVREYDNPVQAGAGCTVRPGSSDEGGSVQCPADGVTQIRFDLGDKNDRFSGDEEDRKLAVQAYGGPGDDALYSGSGNDLLDGGDGRDSLNGGPGKDVVLGGAGNDSLSDGDSDGDRVDGGAGDDNLTGGVGNDSLQGGSGDDNLTGGDGDDALDGGSGDDSLDGGRGDDRLTGGPGDDDVLGGRGADRIDTADSQAEHTLTCGQGSDHLIADAHDAINVDCEAFEVARLSTTTASVSLPVACPEGCTSGRVVLTVAGRRLGEGKVGRSAARVRFTRRLTKGRHGNVRVTIVARDSAGRTYRSRGRCTLRTR